MAFNMITENYVSFETAKLLKEKGFDEECDYLYVDGELVRAQGCACNWNKGETLFADYKNECSAPTLQMAMKWLRKTFEIHCQIDCPIAASNWRYGIRDLNQYEWVTIRNMGDYETYEETCEEAIRYCLENLI